MEELLRDDRKRREWLWLRARMKEDWPSIESLERAEPKLREGMAALDAALQGIHDERERTEAYGRALDVMSLDPERLACECPACAAP